MSIPFHGRRVDITSAQSHLDEEDVQLSLNSINWQRLWKKRVSVLLCLSFTFKHLAITL